MTPDRLAALLDLLSAEVLTSAEIQRRLGASQPTVSRLLARAGERVAKLGQGRRSRYAGGGSLFGEVSSAPLYAVSAGGRVSQVATLRALAGGQYLVSGRDLPRWLLGDGGDGLFASLPYFLYDLRPAGFLGRQVARLLARQWDVPADPRRWVDGHIGRYLLDRGDDLPGSLALGEAAARRINQAEPAPVTSRARDYPRLARAVLEDGLPASSAAGEQPKFLACHPDLGQLIVKFSPEGDGAEARRWSDLLQAEALALSLLGERGVPAARASIHRIRGRTYLECQRFDRRGARGRLPALSIGMVDAEFGGAGHGWTRMAGALHRRGLLSAEDRLRVAWLELFGTWIGNTDMHPGNLSLAPQGDGFVLLPAYDMLPMAMAPRHGELPWPALRPPIRTEDNSEVWQDALEAGCEYWRLLARLRGVTGELRRFARAQVLRFKTPSARASRRSKP